MSLHRYKDREKARKYTNNYKKRRREKENKIARNRGEWYTQDEVDFIVRNWKKLTTKEIAMKLKRSSSAISIKRNRLRKKGHDLS